MKPVLLIDLSAIFWSAWHSSANDAVSQATTRTLSGVDKAIGAYGERAVAICCDAGRSFRKDLAETYKAQRPEKDHAAIEELRRIEERLKLDGHLLWKFPTFEADDVIATATQKATAAGLDVTIATGDKDLLQLVGPRVTVLSTRSWEVADEAAVVAKFKVLPSQIGDYLALVGDASDGIKGAPGIGPVKAAELLQKFGSIKNIFVKLALVPDEVGKPAVVKSLRENADGVDLARRLVALRFDVPLEFEEIFAHREQVTLSGANEEMDEPMDAEFVEKDEPMPEILPPAETPEPQTTTTTMVVHRNGTTALPFELQLEPNSLATAHRLAVGMHDSRLYQRFQSPEAIMAVIIRGREMGIPALTALDSFHVIEGKPSPHAYLIIAQAKRHADCEYFQCTSTNSTSATWVTKSRRNPEPTSLTYTIEQARAAGLTGPNWTKRPDEMLRKTAGAQLARMEYPDAAMGLYAVEEMGGEA